jgi:hypothetical protein
MFVAGLVVALLGLLFMFQGLGVVKGRGWPGDRPCRSGVGGTRGASSQFHGHTVTSRMADGH